MIRIVRIPLESAGVEGIFRPVDSELSGVTAGSRRLEIGAGPALVARLSAMEGIPVGGALLTPAGDLGPVFLIHVVIQAQDEAVTAAGVRRALLNGLRRATEWELERIAIPPLGSGAGQLDAGEVASVMIPLIQEYQAQVAFPREVLIVVESDYEEQVFSRAVGWVDHDPSGNGG